MLNTSQMQVLFNIKISNSNLKTLYHTQICHQKNAVLDTRRNAFSLGVDPPHTTLQTSSQQLLFLTTRLH